MIKFLKAIFKDLYEDVKFLFTATKKISKGEKVLDPEKVNALKQSMKETKFLDFKNSYYWIMVILFAFAMGLMLGAEIQTVVCNNYIIENYIEGNMGKPYETDLNSTPSINLNPIDQFILSNDNQNKT